MADSQVRLTKSIKWSATVGGTDTIFSCTIVTTSCSKQLSFLHDRMPVIFDANSKELYTWMDNSKAWDNATFGTLLKPYEKKLACYPVTPEVGRIGRSSADFVTPVGQLKGSLGSFFAKVNSSQSSQKSENAGQKQRIKTEEEVADTNLADAKSQRSASSLIKTEDIDETDLEAKQEDGDVQRAIELSLQDKYNDNGADVGSTSRDGNTGGMKREMGGERAPERAKHRRIDPAKQMKSPSKSQARKGVDTADKNKKITSFFSKS